MNTQNFFFFLLQAKILTVGGLKQDDVCVLAYDHMQVIQLRRFLRKANLSSVCQINNVHYRYNLHENVMTACIMLQLLLLAPKGTDICECGIALYFVCYV